MVFTPFLSLVEQLEQDGFTQSARLRVDEDKSGGEYGVNIKNDGDNIQDLTYKYNHFLQTSLFQNILVAQERFNKNALSKSDGVNQESNEANIKDEFYSAINAGDKIKTVGILRTICAQGKLKDFFKNDERYKDFFSGYLVRHKGEKERDEFLQNPQQAKYIIEFLKFILTKRLDFSLEESAMIGVGLAVLCNKAGEKEFSEMAFGDEDTNKFVWGI